MTRRLALSAAVMLGSVVVLPASAQTLEERMDAVRARHAAEQQAQAPQPTLNLDQRLAARMSVTYEGSGFRDTLEDWADRTGVPVFVNWRAMENEGVDPEAPIELLLEDVSAAQVLLIVMDLASEEHRFIAQAKPWGLELFTREQANRNVRVVVYDVNDLVFEIPSFTDAPEIDLGEALEGGAGESGGGGSSLFGDEDSDDDEELTKDERGERLAETVRQTVEPDVWIANGGEYSSVRYRDGRLIVRAPDYVHQQIAGSVPAAPAATPRTSDRYTSGADPTPTGSPAVQSNGIAGVAPAVGHVAGVAESP